MAVDSDRHRAFLLCGGNRQFTVFALDSHKTIARFPLPQGADVVKFDPGLRRAYAACSSGAITVIQEDAPDRYRKVEDFPVQRLVHSLAVDTSTHRVYVAEESGNGHPVARIAVYEAVAGHEK
jgi:DNA-binding beta-propeller fold protein YncE